MWVDLKIRPHKVSSYNAGGVDTNGDSGRTAGCRMSMMTAAVCDQQLMWSSVQ